MEMNTTRSKILKAMYDLIAEQGYDKTSIGQIADVIGIKKASVYYYFRFKEEIITELVRKLYEYEADDESMENIKTKAQFREYLLDEGYSLVDSFERNEKARRVFAEIDIQTGRIPSLKEYVDSYIQTERERWQNILFYGQNIGAISKNISVESYADFLFTVITGIDDALLYRYPVDIKKVWEMAIVTVLGDDEDRLSY